MRIRRSLRQCVTSSSHCSYSWGEHGFDSPSQAFFISRHFGPAICCHSGSHAASAPCTYLVSWASPATAKMSTIVRDGKRREVNASSSVSYLNGGLNIKRFKISCPALLGASLHDGTLLCRCFG